MQNPLFLPIKTFVYTLFAQMFLILQLFGSKCLLKLVICTKTNIAN